MSILRFEKVRLMLGHMEMELGAEIRSQLTGVFGPSGAGKTTMLELVAGLRKPDEGSIWIGDELVAGKERFVGPEERRVGYVPQDLALFPHLKVRENLLYSTRARHEKGHYEEILETLEIGQLLERMPENLSGGEKQRVAIGRALMSGPKILLLDEPLANLDTSLKTNLLELLRTVTKRLSMPLFYVTHDAEELAALVGEVVMLKSGKLAGHGTFAELFSEMEGKRYAPRV